MEESLAPSATVSSYSSDGQTKQVKEGARLLKDQETGYKKNRHWIDEHLLIFDRAPKLDCSEFYTWDELQPCMILKEKEAEVLEEDRNWLDKVLHSFESAPRLDCCEFSQDILLSTTELKSERKPPEQNSLSADFQRPDSGFYSFDIESIKAGSELDFTSQQSRDAPVSEQTSQSLRCGEMEDVVASDTLNERTVYYHLAEAGDQEHQKNGKRESKSMECHITKDKDKIENCHNQKPKNKKTKQLISYQLHLQSGWDWTTGPLDMKNEWFRLDSFASLTYCRFQKLSFVSLATAGFYHSSEHRKIQCFTCDKCYTPEYLENLLQAHGFSYPPKDLVHEKWCMISDHGNIPIHPSPVCNDIGNPSCNKRAFKDQKGRLIKCENMCGLNTFFMDISHKLAEFPALKDAFKNYRPGKLILEMLEIGKFNSSRGFHNILLHLKMVKPEDTVINLEIFELIRFLCILNKEEIVIERKCRKGCPMQSTFTKEQIIINPPKTTDGEMNIIQQGILEFFKDLGPSSKCCHHCQETVHLTFSHPPPPVLFLNIWRLNCLRGFEVPAVVNILSYRYRVGTVYVHKDQHFTGWIYKPGENQNWTYYDDSKVNQRDKYSADLDRTKEFPGNERMVVISYYLINN